MIVGQGFVGFGIQSLEADTLFAKGKELCKVKREFNDYLYSASLIPEEDDDFFTPVRYGWLLDPTSYLLEIKENESLRQPTCKITLNVLDLEDSTEFYRDVLGLKLYRRRAFVVAKPPETCIRLLIGDNAENEGPMLELVYQYMTEAIDHGNALNKVSHSLHPLSSGISLQTSTI